jgi:hypothetical protein
LLISWTLYIRNNVKETGLCVRPQRKVVPEIGASSIDWAQLGRLLPEDGDTVQSPKRYFYIKKAGRWIMSKRAIIALIYHRYVL